MFDNPSSGGLYVEEGRYVVKVARLEEVPPSPQFPESGPGIKWVFNLQDAQTKEVVKDERGFDGELWQFSSKKLTPRAKARKWAEALLHPTDLSDKTGEWIATNVVGKKAIGLIGPGENGRTAILTMSPLQAAAGSAKPSGAQGQKAAQAAATAVAEPEAPPDEQLDLSGVDQDF